LNNIPNSLSDYEKKDGWKLLFDGVTAIGWRGAYKTGFPDKDWAVENGTITVHESKGKEGGEGGDIVTTDEYSAFDLSFEFKLTPGANSGVKYFVTLVSIMKVQRSVSNTRCLMMQCILMQNLAATATEHLLLCTILFRTKTRTFYSSYRAMECWSNCCLSK
jgi:hypothetical protein